jgi:hypothetical protein
MRSDTVERCILLTHHMEEQRGNKVPAHLKDDSHLYEANFVYANVNL